MQKTLDEDRTSDAAEQESFDTLAAEVEAIDKDLTRLRKLEAAKAVTAKSVTRAETVHEGSMARGGLSPIYAVPKQNIAPQDFVWRALTCKMKAHFTKQSPIEILKQEYGDDEPTRAVLSFITTKAAAVPADTVTSGWASQLVETSIQDFFSALLPNSVYPALASRGGKFSFGRAGIVSMPTRASTPTIAGSFVAQGAPIPVRQGAFSAITFTPKKMAVISTFTREIAEHSTPAIEGLIRQAIVEDTAVAIDSVLLDATAATTTRPAGLRAGVAATTATAGGGIAAVIGDIRALTGALITGTNGNMRSPVWIMNPADALGDFSASRDRGRRRIPVQVGNFGRYAARLSGDHQQQRRGRHDVSDRCRRLRLGDGRYPALRRERPGHAAHGGYDAIADRNGRARFRRARNAGSFAVADRHDRRADVARPELGSTANRRRCLDANHDVELRLRRPTGRANAATFHFS